MDIRVLLERMLRHSEEILADIEGCSRIGFEADSKTQRAVYMSIHQIGGLVGRLPEAFMDLHPELPWRGIKQTRNIIAHEYIRIDMDIIWQTITKSIPEFKGAIAECLRSIADGKEPSMYKKDAEE